jgi:hypothetical protein
MKTKIIRKLFMQMQSTITPPFVQDESCRGHPQFLSVHRTVKPGQWQFLGLTFVPQRHNFFLDVAVSPSSSFPLEMGLSDPGDSLRNGIIRIRANELWSSSHCFGGWIIYDKDPVDDIDEMLRSFGLGDPEGIFKTNEAAFESLKFRIDGWVLPTAVPRKSFHIATTYHN